MKHQEIVKNFRLSLECLAKCGEKVVIDYNELFNLAIELKKITKYPFKLHDDVKVVHTNLNRELINE